MTEDCRTLRDHLGQLVKAGKLKQFLHQPAGHIDHARSRYQKDVVARPTLGTINVIFAMPRCDVGSCLGIMSVASKQELWEQDQESKRVRLELTPILGFLKEDKVGTFQPHCWEI